VPKKKHIYHSPTARLKRSRADTTSHGIEGPSA